MVRYVAVSPAVRRQALIAHGIPAEFADALDKQVGRSSDVLPKIKSNGRRVSSVHWFAGVLQSLCSPS
jgi:hypothetical protein